MFAAALDLARAKGKAPEFLQAVAVERNDGDGVCCDEYFLLQALTGPLGLVEWSDALSDLSYELLASDEAAGAQVRQLLNAIDAARLKE